MSCIDDEESSDEDDIHGDGEEVIASHGVLAEQHEKPDDLLDNYFLPGEDDFEVSFTVITNHHSIVQCERGAVGMIVVSLRGVNYEFYHPLGYF